MTSQDEARELTLPQHTTADILARLAIPTRNGVPRTPLDGSSSSAEVLNAGSSSQAKPPAAKILLGHRRFQSLGLDAAAPSADELVQTAIVLHEEMRLDESTACFRRAAELGSSVGMYMYGLALRSGWGCKVDQVKAFEFFSRAADVSFRRAGAVAVAVPGGSTNPECLALIHGSFRELAIAVYELAQSFFNGWGVKRSRRKGAFYLRMAADMGDTDAQVDMATCLMSGDGVRENKMEAARYFRLASLASVNLPSNSWIWKDKYDKCGILRDSAPPKPELPLSLIPPS